MSTLLQITSSIVGENSHSTSLSNDFVSQWQKKNPDGKVIHRDLAKEPIPHLDGVRLQALFTPAEQRTPEQQQVVATADALINELHSADVVVLGVPLYNFGMPSVLKAYFDHVARAGVTFRYTENGPVGLLPDVPVYVFATRGGFYGEAPVDWQLTTFLNFIGLKSVEYVYAEGLSKGDDSKQKALDTAHQRIAQLIAA